MVKITPSQSFSLSCVRIIATVFIFTCHILQGYGNMWAFLFNVGVQIFFFLSGFLYGKKTTINTKEFYISRMQKVYIPFAIFIIIINIANFFAGYRIGFIQIIEYLFNIQAFVTPIEGLNHLWFLSVLMICYAITPIVIKCIRKNPYLFFTFSIVLLFIHFVWIQKMYSISLWVMIYIIGICYGKYESKWLKYTLLFVSFVILCIMLQSFSFNKLVNPDFSHYNGWFHVVLAVFLFILLYSLCNFGWLMNKLNKVIKKLDAYSYEVYLIHHVFILGPLSILFMTKYSVINIFLVILLTILFAVTLQFIVIHLKKILKL